MVMVFVPSIPVEQAAKTPPEANTQAIVNDFKKNLRISDTKVHKKVGKKLVDSKKISNFALAKAKQTAG